MIWPWLLFDYYHPKSPKSRFAQCFQWFSESSEKLAVLVKNRTTLENTALYPDAPEDSERRHCSCQALSLCKKQDANSNAWACVLLLPVPAVPLWHIVYLWGETVETSGLFAVASIWVQLDGKQHPFRSLDLKSPEISRVFAFPASQSSLVSRAE